MMETEGDTLTNTLLSDHGNYSDVLRKSFHNEPVSYLRRTNHEKNKKTTASAVARLWGSKPTNR